MLCNYSFIGVRVEGFLFPANLSVLWMPYLGNRSQFIDPSEGWWSECFLLGIWNVTHMDLNLTWPILAKVVPDRHCLSSSVTHLTYIQKIICHAMLHLQCAESSRYNLKLMATFSNIMGWSTLTKVPIIFPNFLTKVPIMQSHFLSISFLATLAVNTVKIFFAEEG